MRQKISHFGWRKRIVKKKYIILGAVGVLALFTTVGGTLAALNTDTEGGVGAAAAGISLENIGITIYTDII